MNRLIWMGPALSTESVQTFPHVSPAAAWWNSRLVQALQHLGTSSYVATHIPQPLWPRGHIHVPPAGDFPIGISGSTVGYWNLPGLRQWSLFRGYRHTTKSRLLEPEFLVTYNPYPFALWSAFSITRTSSLKWVCVFADAVSSHHLHNSVTNRALRAVDGRVFLSWHDYTVDQSVGTSPSLHLDGGVDVVRKPAAATLPSRPTVLYTGALSRHAGLNLLVESLSFLDRDIQVIVCGKGTSESLAQAISDNRFGNRLRFPGWVDEPTLHQLSLSATCFVNPRPTISESKHNFPSKILRYLGYGQPIASTRSPGLSPDYEDILTFADSDSPRDIASSIEAAVNAAESQIEAQKRRNFVASHTWEHQAARFMNFLDII